MTEAEKNVLAAVVEQTLILRGKNRGKIKALISTESFYYRPLSKLGRAGLIEYRVNTIHGDGCVATAKGLQAYTELKSSASTRKAR